jgi:hypothetical protein
MQNAIITITLAVLVLGFAGMAEATIVDISVATSKTMYELGEDVGVFVIAYNPNPEPVILTFPSSTQASYLMDNIYDWKEHHGAWPVITEKRIEAFGSYTWTPIHGTDEMETYLPTLGMHTIVGEVLGYGYSTQLEFKVIPEPLTVSFLVIGFIVVRARHCRLSLQ